MQTFPSATDEVTPAFLTEALRSTGTIGRDTAVAEVHHETIGEGVGIVGQLARLTLRYAGPATGAPGSVVVKLPSHLPENRAIGEHFRFYEARAGSTTRSAERSRCGPRAATGTTSTR